MKRRRNKERRNLRALRLWTYEEAARAVPYLRSVLSSLREHWLAAQRERRAGELPAARPGRPDRERLLTGEDLQTRQEGAENRFNEALEELMGIDVYLLDPVKGVALIPFRKEDDLAWYVFDQFDNQGLSGWRFHNDPMERCRPLTTEMPPQAAL
jgi:Uncharacterized conserved protein (DUF2203)